VLIPHTAKTEGKAGFQRGGEKVQPVRLRKTPKYSKKRQSGGLEDAHSRPKVGQRRTSKEKRETGNTGSNKLNIPCQRKEPGFLNLLEKEKKPFPFPK